MGEGLPIIDYGRPGSPSYRARHVGLVLLSAFASTIVMYFTANTFGSIRGGEVFIFGMVLVGVVTVLTLLGAIATRETSRMLEAVFVIAPLIPSTLIFAGFGFAEVKFRINGPTDRFKDNVANPVPATVTEIQFVDLSETIDPELVLRFKISPADLDRILRDRQYAFVQSGSFRNPKDRFTNVNYLSIGGADDEFFQLRLKEGDEYTIRTNKKHDEVIFRRESSIEYKHLSLP